MIAQYTFWFLAVLCAVGAWFSFGVHWGWFTGCVLLGALFVSTYWWPSDDRSGKNPSWWP